MRVLVLGGSGWLGSAVVPRLREFAEVRAPRSAETDAADAAAVGALFAAFRPETVVNLAAAQASAGTEEAMARVNVLGAAHVAACAAAHRARLVHMSTDLVLDGRSPPYADDARANPVNAYGRTKARGEEAVRAACPGALVLRTSLVFDPWTPDRFTRGAAERLARGESVALFTDEFRCPVSRGALAAALAEIVGRPEIAGRLNLAGAERVSRFDFGTRLLRRFGAARLDLVRPALAAESPEPRPLDLALDTSRARSLLASPLPGAAEELRAPLSGR